MQPAEKHHQIDVRRQIEVLPHARDLIRRHRRRRHAVSDLRHARSNPRESARFRVGCRVQQRGALEIALLDRVIRDDLRGVVPRHGVGLQHASRRDHVRHARSAGSAHARPRGHVPQTMDVDEIRLLRLAPHRISEPDRAPTDTRRRERKIPHPHTLVRDASGRRRQRLVTIRRRREHLDVGAGLRHGAAQTKNGARRAAVPERGREIRRHVQHTERRPARHVVTPARECSERSAASAAARRCAGRSR